MPDQDMSFGEFLTAVEPWYQDFVMELHGYLLENGCKLKLQKNKGGQYVVSYQQGKGKRVLLNFVFRKSGLVTRIYGDNTEKYAEFMDNLPKKMVETIEKTSSDCKYCNPRCPKGYAFSIRGKEYLKCRYNSFMFPVEDDGLPFIRSFVENELIARSA